MKMRMPGLILLLLVSAVVMGADNPSGFVVWEDQTDHGGADAARAIAISGSTAVAAGLLSAPGQGLDFSVKAYDLETGAVRWENHVPAFPGLVTSVFVAASEDSVFALGYVSGAADSSTDLFVRAYSVATGNVLWTDNWDAGRDDLPKGIAVAGGHVTIVGYGGNSNSGEPPHALDGLVRTYDAITGALLWESRIDKTNSDDAVWAVAANETHVATAGTTAVGTRTDLVLRAYRARTGKLLWETQRMGVSPSAVRTNAGRVYVVGIEGSKTFLAAFDLVTGALIWQVPGIDGFFMDVDVNQLQVVAVGTAARARLVQSVRPDTGAGIWSDHPAPQPGKTESLRRLVIHRGSVYAVGSSGQDFSFTETLLRAYSPAGGLLHDERSHRSAGFNLWGAVAAGGKHLIAAGEVMNMTPDAAVRGYDVTTIQSR